MNRWIVVAVIALIACKKSNKQPVTTSSGSSSDAAQTAVIDAAPAAVDAAAPAWELSSKPVELDCGPPAFTGSYKASLDAGRAAGKAKKWAEAVAAFERALAVQKDDPAALSELAWATLQVGDAKRSLELAERAITVATSPNAQAASHFNAGRAAEALGDIARAKSHYEKSVELRPNDAIAERLAKLAVPPPRSLPPGQAITACQDLASVDEVCKCLATSSKATGIEGKATCEPAKERGTRAQLVVVQGQPDDPDATAGGTAIVLVAKRGEKWSALQVVETADDVDLTVTPKAMHAATVLAYEERDTTIWVETRNQYSETSVGDHDVRGEAGLTICRIPSAVGERASCNARIPLAAWDYTQAVADDQCEVRSMFAFRAVLSSDDTLVLVLAAGVDNSGRAGRYQR